MKTQSSWDNFYMDLAYKVSELSYAEDCKVGCVIVKEGNILSFSYNGTAPGTNNSTEVSGHTLSTVFHAEEAALCKLLKEGRSPAGATLYCTLSSCIQCAKLIYQSGITRVVYREPYKDLSGVEFLSNLGVLVNQPLSHNMLFTPEQLKYTGLLND